MKIGIYKPCKTIWWNDWSKDTNVWSREIIGLTQLLADREHSVHLLSDTDYQNTIHNISATCIPTSDNYDVLVVFNGAFSKNPISEDALLSSVKYKKSILIASDLDLAMQEHNHNAYDKVLTANIKSVPKNFKYGAVQDYHMYRQDMYKGGWEARQHKGLFIGHDRHKEEDFMEFVWRPDIVFYGKASSINVNKIIPRNQAYDELRKYTYSPVFFDKRVNDIGFITARPLELMLFGIVPFICKDYDKHNLQFLPTDERRVQSYAELYDKAQNMGKEKFLELQNLGFEQLQKIQTGDLAYKLFMDAVA